MVAEWHAPVPTSNKPPITLPPPEDRPKQVIKDNPVVNLEEEDDGDDDLERIDDPKGVMDYQGN